MQALFIKILTPKCDLIQLTKTQWLLSDSVHKHLKHQIT